LTPETRPDAEVQAARRAVAAIAGGALDGN